MMRNDYFGDWGEVIDLIGEEAAQRIIEERGGVRLYICKQAREDIFLSSVIGIDLLERLIANFGGTCIDVPTDGAERRRKRNKEIVKLNSEGIPVANIARKFEMTSRNVWRILAVERKESKQAKRLERYVVAKVRRNLRESCAGTKKIKLLSLLPKSFLPRSGNNQ